MTWPWAAHIRDSSFDPGDSYLNSWILAWDYHQTTHDPLHLFDANIFFPYRYTLALSEHQWGIALLFFPAFAAGVPPLTVHGLAMLLGFALSGFGAFRLARTLTGSAVAAWIAGIAFAFVPYRFHHLPHLSYVFAGWMPLLAEAVVLFARRRTWARAAWLGAAFFMSGVSSIHWFLLGSVPTVALAALLILREDASARREWGRAAAALGAASLLLVPFFLPYQRVGKLYGIQRGPEEAAVYSARFVHWLTPDFNLKLWRGMGQNPAQGEFCLFPGFLLLALALLGAVLSVRIRTRAGAAGLLFAGIGFVGSFGMSTPFHRLLFLVPPFRAIRAPIRWAMVADLGFALLAGIAAAALVEAWSRRRSGAFGIGISVFLAGALLFEDRVAPLYLNRGEPDPDPLSRFLAATSMSGGLWELPDGFDETNAHHVLRAADHWKPLVNGYSGFQTPLAQKLHDLLAGGKTGDLLDALEAVPVSFVTVRPGGRMTTEQRVASAAFVAAAVTSGRLVYIRRFPPDHELYALVKTEPGARPLESSSPAAERASAAGIESVELTGSIDAPEAEAVVGGDLAVKGWARVSGRDLGVTVLIDGAPRIPLRSARVPRPDVQAAVPVLGDCANAGYESVFTFQPGDEGEHELSVVFSAPDGRVRHFPSRKFTWRKSP